MSSSSISTLNLRRNQIRIEKLCKFIAISGLIVFLFFSFFHNHPYNAFDLSYASSADKVSNYSANVANSPTNISHIMFVLVGCIKTWKYRRPYIEAWWRENITRGNIWLDEPPPKEYLPWRSSSPPFQIKEEITKFKIYPKLVNPIEVRIYRSILDTFRLENDKDVRWYVMADDDTLFFIDNLVEVLRKYDHTKYYYIGTNSESIHSNYHLSFEMGYGGAGYALSYALVKDLVSKMDDCVDRYPHLYVSDYLSSSCSADLGVDLTIEKGIHQIDLHGDISGLLSSHPNSPAITLHHFDSINSIFPSKSRSESIDHLMMAGNVDQSRLLQQIVCHHRQNNWTFSISWGYSTHLYESILPRSILKRPLETFSPWQKETPPLYMFNTRPMTDNPCEAPHIFFLDTIESDEGERVITSYARRWSRNLPPCALTGNQSADHVSKIQVFSPATRCKEAGQIECCDVEYISGKNTAEIKLRDCIKGEVLA